MQQDARMLGARQQTVWRGKPASNRNKEGASRRNGSTGESGITGRRNGSTGESGITGRRNGNTGVNGVTN